MKKVFNKLVRDNIPDIIISSNRKCTVKTLSDDEYQAMLDAKLNEELSEYQQSKSLEELADLLEVIHAIVIAKGYCWNEFLKLRQKKLEERGGFEKRLLLIDITD